MGNLTYPTFIIILLLLVLWMSPEQQEMRNKLGARNRVICVWRTTRRNTRNLCCARQSDSLSYMRSSARMFKQTIQTIEICNTEEMLWQSQRGSTIVMILHHLKQYCSCSCALIDMQELDLKNNNVHNFGAEDYIHLDKAQRCCTSTWYYLTSNSLLIDGYAHNTAETLETHSNNGQRKKTELHAEECNIKDRLPHIFHKYNCPFLCQTLSKTEKIVFGLILVIFEFIILLSDAKPCLKFYNYDFSSTKEKVREIGKHDGINPRSKKPSPTDKEQAGFKAEATASFVFRFRKFDIGQSLVYPASLDHYFKDVFHSKQSPSDLHKYEWTRYKSFKHYPDSAVVMPLLLAKDGFYYTGYEDEVRCHFCGFTHRNWKRGDNVHSIHKKLSRNCKLVSGGETDNVSITECKGQFHNETVEAACGGPTDTNTLTEILNKLNLKETTDAKSLQKTDNGEKSSDAAKKDTSATNNDNDKRNAVSPKHPAYAVEAVRLSSYSKWPTVVQPSPTVLCDAGFFYAGFGDCVRCFFCGGGLRNWEYGDTPWVEHARWYPTCEYLLSRKGQQFIEMHRQDINRDEEVAEANAYSEQEESNVTTSDQEATRNANSFEESPAMQTILEMGYTQDIILSAIETLRQKGNEHYTATDIMEIILENERKSSDSNSNDNTISAQNNESEDPPSHGHSQLLNDNTTLSSGEAMARANKPSKAEKQHCATDKSYLSKDCQSLVIENRQLKDQLLCKICMDKDACMVFLPCGHMVSCQKCSATVRKCCICRKLIKGTVKAYL